MRLLRPAQAVAEERKLFPVDGGASLFTSSKAQRESADANGMIVLSEEALLKGGAAGIIQRVLEDAVERAKALYPPP